MCGKVIFKLRYTIIAGVGLILLGGSAVGLRAQDDPTPERGTLAEDVLDFHMVYVPSGNVQMGVPIEDLESLNRLLELDIEANFENSRSLGVLDVYTTTVTGFWIDQYEVTIAQYQEYHHLCMATGRCLDVRTLGRPELETDVQQPQVGVSWYDAMMFCNMRGARLPTEVEWEYAASGPENFLFPWGNNPDLQNVRSNALLEGTYPVGSLAQNVSWVGAYDMAGNAAEWVEDRFGPYPSVTESWVLSFPSTEYYRVVRGGYYVDNLAKMTTYERVPINPGASEPSVGFRCARSSDPRIYQ